MGCGISANKEKPKEPLQNQNKNYLDENLYSRQMAVYGVEIQQKIMKMKVFIQGLSGLGVEIAKNIVLAGPASVTIYDDKVCMMADSGVNFFVQEKHVKNGFTRADASAEQLKQLNPYCEVKVKKGGIDAEFLSEFNVVVFTDFYDKSKLIQFNKECRSKGIGFIYTGNLGLYGFAFVDFGDKHKVCDNNGEDLKHTIIVSISQDTKGIVTTHEDKRHGLVDGDHVTFKEVQGMVEVNNQIYKVKVLSPYTFTIDQDTTKFHMYEREGIVSQVKVCEEISFKSLNDSLMNPFAPQKKSLDICDQKKLGRPEELHLILNGILQFCSDHEGRLPEILSQEDSHKLFEIVQTLLQKNKEDLKNTYKVEQLNEQLVKNIALFAKTSISPVTSFWGGIVAQEIIKFTGKLSPLRQWLHHEVFECLPDSPTFQKAFVDSQQGYQIAIFGQQFQETLSKLKQIHIRTKIQINKERRDDNFQYKILQISQKN